MVTRRVRILDPLRGLASCAVLWFHIGYANQYAAYRDGALGITARYGFLGVEAFFVISGFVLPYAMHASGYEWRLHWRHFLGKRLVRLDPPYFVAIGLGIVLGYLASLAPGYRGQPFHVSYRQVLLHLGYAAAFTANPRESWLNPVFWTLAIEFQYYLVLTLSFPLVMTTRKASRWAVYAIIIFLALDLPNPNLVPRYLPLFGLGFATVQRETGRIDSKSWLILLALCAATVGVTLGWPQAVAGLGTALLIGGCAEWGGNPVLRFLGTISYSLYLVHLPVGGRVVDLGTRFGDSPAIQIGVEVMAIVVSIGVAFLLYQLVERPAQRWSQTIAYPSVASDLMLPTGGLAVGEVLNDTPGTRT